MRAVLAIMGDTWRQSKKQVVFIITIVLVMLMALAAVALPKVVTDGDGDKDLGTLFSDRPTALWQTWTETYHQTRMQQEGKSTDIREAISDPEAFRKKQDERRALREEAVRAETGLSKLRRSVEMWILISIQAMFTVSMILFIAACAGYFPDLRSAGAIDVVLAKPVSRIKVYLGKYLGGLVLFSALIVCFDLILFLVFGLRTGVWVDRIFLTIFLQIFTAGVLFAILSLVGVVSRSATLATLFGYLFYLFLDTVLGYAQVAQMSGAMKEIAWLDRTVEITRYVLPNFTILKDAATSRVLDLPAYSWSPLGVAGAWLVGCLGIGYLIFHRRDF